LKTFVCSDGEYFKELQEFGWKKEDPLGDNYLAILAIKYAEKLSGKDKEYFKLSVKNLLDRHLNDRFVDDHAVLNKLYRCFNLKTHPTVAHNYGRFHSMFIDLLEESVHGQVHDCLSSSPESFKKTVWSRPCTGVDLEGNGDYFRLLYSKMKKLDINSSFERDFNYNLDLTCRYFSYEYDEKGDMKSRVWYKVSGEEAERLEKEAYERVKNLIK
jgi:hypothetical protein